MSNIRLGIVIAVFGIAILIGPQHCTGQSNYFFGQDNRFVPSFQNGAANSGSFFDQNRFNSQFRPVPDYSQQQIYNENEQTYPDIRFNDAKQQPTSFRTQTGRGQTTSQFFLNHDNFAPIQQSNNQPSKPTSFQFNNHPASTSRPEFPRYVQSSHNHDPSKETFLGQITINNPFPETIHEFNSARIRQPSHTGFNSNVIKNQALDNIDLQSGFPNAPEPVDQDLYEYTEKTKPTTYNPAKLKPGKTVFNARPGLYNPIKQDESENLQRKPFSSSDENYFNSNENNFSNSRSRFKPKPSSTTTPYPQTDRKNRFSPSTKAPTKLQAYNLRANKVGFSPNRPHYTSTTEYKSLFDLEPLLEDEIPDRKLFGDTLRSHLNGSEDVQVIKSAEITTSPVENTEPEKTTIIDIELTTKVSVQKESVDKSDDDNEHFDITTTERVHNQEEKPISEEENTKISKPSDSEVVEHSETEYYDEDTEYVDETDGENRQTHHENHDLQGEEVEYEDGSEITDSGTTTGEAFEVLTMKPKPVMVKDDNFKGFVDSSLIDSTEPPTFVTEQYVKPDVEESVKTTIPDQTTTQPPPILLGEQIVSVVTTKSVINGTYKIPDHVDSASTQQMSDNSSTTPKNLHEYTVKQTVPNVTESWVVVASVQTSRSVSGARFLPFPGIAQEEKKQILFDSDNKEMTTPTFSSNTEEDGSSETTTVKEEDTNFTTNKPLSSTESINDILDRVQSELSIGLLSSGFKGTNQNFTVLTEMPNENMTKEEITTMTPPLQIFTVKQTSSTSTTERVPPEPLPVTIKKFSPYARPSTSTTPKPKIKPNSFDNIKMDDLTGFLPPGFKVRPSFKDRKITTTTEKTQLTTVRTKEENQSPISPKSSFKNKVVVQDNISAFLPKGYVQPKTEKPPSIDDLFKNIKTDDISHLLPSGYKPPSEEKLPVEKTPKIPKNNILAKTEPVDITAFLPKGYKIPTTTEKIEMQTQNQLLAKAKPIDISAFLPPGFKPKKNDTINDNQVPSPKTIQIADVSAFLPPGFKTNSNTANVTTEKPSVVETATKSTGGALKIVFPSRPGVGKPGKRLTTSKPNEGGPSGGVSAPSILKGWPSRATTEFTGWPSPSTTPFSIQKLIEEQKAATATSVEEASIEASTTSKPTTTAFTTPSTTSPTTPGVCGSECDLVATIKIVGGVKWVPELLDHNTKEWQLLANEVSRELDTAYSRNPLLKKWYKGIRIDGFSKGSVLVDYFVELNDVSEKIDTYELKKLFHKSLTEAQPGSVIEEIVKDDKQPDKITGRKIDGFDPDMMLGDEPYEARMEKAEPIREIIDMSKGKLEIGKFVLDPVFTEFIVLPKRIDPTIGYAEDNTVLPQWGIAVIVIALASLLFVVIFGVTVLVNRQKSAKAKQPIPLSEDMLRELDKSHMGGADDMYMQDHEPPYPTRNHKRGSTAMLDSLSYPGNPGDSWRSEWGPYYNQYHSQHYAPDSGRGSQSYTGGNNYGYNGSQLYGYNGMGSQNYGYSGEGVRTLHPRRRSDFDSNF